ncbi:3-isopropylmalate dehydratase [Bacillus sp. PS06]|uniref:3-isopropylmalate dehydratase n=1 Tax=Bacillus sp. PS06 TaxID=2764176 RepID=UPI00177E81D8|nr:3-isopropylmalate dehydratase [Bacillus sp. PS06]MBD8068009.1 3-isopropylmalate dehydratase [Bacillus sp. PS06]
MGEISKQSYIVMDRVIENNQQITVQTRKELYLYHESIESSDNTFLLSNVLDVSYKSGSSNFGVLYLHTIQGLFPYQVDTDPAEFIMKYYELKKR